MKLWKAGWLGLMFVVGACDASGDGARAARHSELTAAQCDKFEVGGKVQICHATGSKKNPYTVLKVSEQACINAHAGHANDYVAVNDPTCHGGGCLPAAAPCDVTLPCCDGLSCVDGTCRPASVDLCAAEGAPACAVANTLLTCDVGGACSDPVCAPGFANCDRSSPACETPIGAAGGCFPAHLGTYTTPTGSGGVAAIGADGSHYFATVDYSADPSLGNTAVLTKLNSDGSVAWTRSWTGASAVIDHRRIVVGADGVSVMGIFWGSVDFDPGVGTVLKTSGATATFVTHFSLDGEFGWVSTIESTSDSQGTALSIDPSGAVVVAGTFAYNVDLDPGPGTDVVTSAGLGGFIVKLDGADGSRRWSTTLGGANCQLYLDTATVTPAGTLWLAGSVWWGECAIGDQLVTPLSHFLASVSPAGEVTARGVLSDGGLYTTRALAAAPDGSVYLAGAGRGFVDLDPGPGVVQHVLLGPDFGGSYVLKLGPDGAFQWAQTFPLLEYGGLAARADGSVLYASILRDISSGSSDGIVVTKLEADSTPAWSISWGALTIAPTGLAAGPGGFDVAGAVYPSQSIDFDPGPGVDPVSSTATFLSRFAN
jgi:hypothetical protein